MEVTVRQRLVRTVTMIIILKGLGRHSLGTSSIPLLPGLAQPGHRPHPGHMERIMT